MEKRTIAFTASERVEVLPDNRPGVCSHGGTGWIMAVSKGAGGYTKCTVRYDQCAASFSGGLEEKDILHYAESKMKVPVNNNCELLV